MAGKWEQVVKGLDRLPSELREGGAARAEEVEKAKVTITDRTPTGLAQLYARLRETKDEADREARAAGIQVEAVSDLLVAVFENQGLDSLKLSGVGTLRKQDEPHAQITDREKFRKWCVDEGLTNMMFLHPSTASSLVKERLLDARDTPPGVEVYFKSRLFLTREK